MIEIKSLRKSFASNGSSFEALKGIDLAVSAGDLIAITGESGSGKSTLLAVLGGVLAPSRGSVSVDGIDIYGLHPERLADFRREYIGFVFQQFHLMPYLTAVENVMLPLAVIKRNSKKEAALEALRTVGLLEKADCLPGALSGGQQQRVAIARALVNKPPIILADEPTGNLDTKTGQEIFSLFRELNSGGQTVVMVTHNIELAAKAGKRVRLSDGFVLGID